MRTNLSRARNGIAIWFESHRPVRPNKKPRRSILQQGFFVCYCPPKRRGD